MRSDAQPPRSDGGSRTRNFRSISTLSMYPDPASSQQAFEASGRSAERATWLRPATWATKAATLAASDPITFSGGITAMVPVILGGSGDARPPQEDGGNPLGPTLATASAARTV